MVSVTLCRGSSSPACRHRKVDRPDRARTTGPPRAGHGLWWLGPAGWHLGRAADVGFPYLRGHRRRVRHRREPDPFYTVFRHVVLLSAPLPVLLERVQTRLNNPYGRTDEQQNETRTYVRDVEPLLRAAATVELDAQMPVTALADAIEALI